MRHRHWLPRVLRRKTRGASNASDPPKLYGDLPEKVKAVLERAYRRAEAEGISPEEIDRRIEEAVSKASIESGKLLVGSLHRRAPGMLREHRRYKRGFERRLRKLWGQALDRYYMVYVSAKEFGAGFNRVHRDGAARDNDCKFDALTRIHARACLTASEVHAMLRTGHATGAHSRWRTLHELAVVASIIGDGDQELADRYLLYAGIEASEDAKHYEKHHTALGYEPLEPEVVKELKEQRSLLVKRFGKRFEKPHGWAAELFPGAHQIRISDLERHARLDHLRPFYRWSSHTVHPGPHGAALNIYESAARGRIMLTGPSNAGLVDPGHGSLISLVQVTCALGVHGRPEGVEFLTASILLALRQLTDEAGDAFLKAHQTLEAQEALLYEELEAENDPGPVRRAIRSALRRAP